MIEQTTTSGDEVGRPIENPFDVFSLIFEQAHGDALVALGSRRPGKRKGKGIEAAPRWLCPVPVKELRSWLPGLFNFRTDETQYFAPRATFKPSALLGRAWGIFAAGIEAGTPVYFPVKVEHALELCAVALDLDVGREGMITGEVALGLALSRCRSGLVPWPHLGALSGRGAYLVWLLTDTSGARAIPADAGTMATFKNVTRELCHRLADLEADLKSSSNIVGWMKRPGTIDTKTGREVVYVRFGGKALPRRYTLGALTDALELVSVFPSARPTARPLTLPTGRPAALEQTAPRSMLKAVKVRATRGLGQAYRIHLDLVNLVNRRGLIRDTTRHNFAWAYFASLRPLVGSEHARRKTWLLAHTRFESDQDGGLVTLADIQGMQEAYWAVVTRKYLADRAFILKVTPEEMLDMRELISLDVRAQRAQAAKDIRAERQAHFSRARREVERLLRANPSAGDERVAQACGVSRKAVSLWRHALGIHANPRGNKTKRARR